MKKRFLFFISTLIVILIVMFSYIFISTNTFNETYFKDKAIELHKNQKDIMSWKECDVKLVKLNNVTFTEGTSEKFNRLLLKLNGNRAVRVTLTADKAYTLNDTRIIYFNPFTKKVIGRAPIR